MNEPRFCQSCGMPLDPQENLGTNADGSTAEEYCKYCYENGAFTQDVTMDEMISISLEHMKVLFREDPNFREEEAVHMMKGFFPTLKRWKKA